MKQLHQQTSISTSRQTHSFEVMKNMSMFSEEKTHPTFCSSIINSECLMAFQSMRIIVDTET